LADNLLFGQGKDLDSQISSFITSFDKHAVEIIQWAIHEGSLAYSLSQTAVKWKDP
jgi:hypothetical protein